MADKYVCVWRESQRKQLSVTKLGKISKSARTVCACCKYETHYDTDETARACKTIAERARQTILYVTCCTAPLTYCKIAANENSRTGTVADETKFVRSQGNNTAFVGQEPQVCHEIRPPECATFARQSPDFEQFVA